ncbi:MAG: DUF1156 domain-containing protein [Gemmataceae bacterium]|nr:DUF1156 domain-containing protein [Gemmataceae bacterium]
MNDEKRLIEDYLPIQAISAEASREKSVRQGHISTLHLWWARRPLTACRAAVYGALVPADLFQAKNGPEEKRVSLGRANAAKFIARLCQFPGSPHVISEAQCHILKAHAERLTVETGKKVTTEDIVEGRSPRPKVLDMFAGGGAIPLEALRLGCEAYANDLNPVAHIVQLCTLVYPQKYGKADTARGMTGPKNTNGETTWGGLAQEFRYWAERLLKHAKAEIGDLYPLIPDPQFKGQRGQVAPKLWNEDLAEVPSGYLVPIAYLWTRTVKCKNPSCGAILPLVRQTWLCKKDGRSVALRLVVPKKGNRVRFEVAHAQSEKGLGFDPGAFSKGGNATCAFCGTVADSNYVKGQGVAALIAQQMMAVVCTRPGERGKTYLSSDDVPISVPNSEALEKRLQTLRSETGITTPNEPIVTDAKNSCWTHLYGLKTFGDLFMHRQLCYLLTLSAAVHAAQKEIDREGYDDERKKALATYLAVLVDRQADYDSTLCVWEAGGEFIKSTFTQKGLPMTWDFVELAPFGEASGSPTGAIDWIVKVLEAEAGSGKEAVVHRGSAASLPWQNESFDAVITDPPYYDNVPYANISDFFYVWLKRTIGRLYPEHFASEATPKKSEAVADATRHGGSKEKASRAYEATMASSLNEAYRVLKRNGQVVMVYAHKTTLGWSTVVEAMRKTGFIVTEAWPLDTERPGRVRALQSAALASSILLIARKGEVAGTGSYEGQVRHDLEEIVRERVETLWDAGVAGADLVIASVGAGLRAFTRFARVEYANGEEVPAEGFLTEVETVVLETILGRLSKEVGGKGGQYSLASLDTASRFYVLWRYTYGAAELDAGEAIIFANGTHVELEGQHGLTGGNDALVEKKKSKYHLRDYAERGENDKLGLATENGQAAPLIDMLHRTLWLMEKRPTELAAFVSKAQPNREQLRLVAQALAGPALKGGEMGDISPTAELSALGKLMANWQSLVEGAALTPWEKDDRKTGQRQLI